MKFTAKEISQIIQRGLDVKTIENQLSCFTNKNTNINLCAPAVVGNGIDQINDKEVDSYASFYKTSKENISVIKFVPASGAASRMFKSLYLFLDNYNINKETINSYVNRTKSIELFLFFVTVEKLPFHDKVFAVLKNNYPEHKQITLDQIYTDIQKLITKVAELERYVRKRELTDLKKSQDKPKTKQQQIKSNLEIVNTVVNRLLSSGDGITASHIHAELARPILGLNGPHNTWKSGWSDELRTTLGYPKGGFPKWLVSNSKKKIVQQGNKLSYA